MKKKTKRGFVFFLFFLLVIKGGGAHRDKERYSHSLLPPPPPPSLSQEEKEVNEAVGGVVNVVGNQERQRLLCANDARKYLSYMPHSGISNQIISLRNGLVMARILNRTLVVPPLLLGPTFSWGPTKSLIGKVAEFEHRAGAKKCQDPQQQLQPQQLQQPQQPQHHQQELFNEDWGRGEGKGGVYTLPASFFLPSSSLEGTVTTTDFLFCQKKEKNDNLIGFSKQLEWEHGRFDLQYSDTPTTTPFSPRFKSSLHFTRAFVSQKKLLMLGSLFGSNRLHLEDERHQKIREKVQNEVVLQNPSLDQLIWSIFRIMDANEGIQEKNKEKNREEGRSKDGEKEWRIGAGPKRGSLWDLEWLESGKKGKRNDWRKERRNYIGLHLRGGDGYFNNSLPLHSSRLTHCLSLLLCTPPSLPPSPPSLSSFLITHPCPPPTGPCIPLSSLSLYIASDLPPHLLHQHLQPLFQITKKIYTLSSFTSLPPSVLPPPPSFVYHPSSFSSFLLHTLTTRSYTPKTKMCVLTVKNNDYLNILIPFLDIILASRGRYFVGTPGSTSSAIALNFYQRY